MRRVSGGRNAEDPGAGPISGAPRGWRVPLPPLGLLCFLSLVLYRPPPRYRPRFAPGFFPGGPRKAPESVSISPRQFRRACRACGLMLPALRFLFPSNTPPSISFFFSFFLSFLLFAFCVARRRRERGRGAGGGRKNSIFNYYH